MPVGRTPPAMFAFAFFTRVMFSCMVNAVRMATKAFCDEPRSAERNSTKRTDPRHRIFR